MSETAVNPGPTVKPLDPAFDDDAAAVLAACTPEGTIDAGRAIVRAAREDANCSLFGLFVDGRLAGAYVLRKAKLMNEIPYLAVAPGDRRKGHGRMCLHDALFRSGKRPLVVETGEDALPFYKAVGFKMVGKRKGADGSPRYRMGWHAPLPKPGGRPGEVVC